MIKSVLKNLFLLKFLKNIVFLLRSHIVEKRFKGKAIVQSLKKIQPDSYNKYKNIREAEHQIGRFLNMIKVAKEIDKLNLKGDIVEFGTWEGVGLHLIDMSFGKQTNRMLVGIDSFEGLPHSSSIWKKGSFSNTSLTSVEEYLDKSIINCHKGFSLIKGWYDDPSVRTSLYSKVSNVAAFHLDSDLGSSTNDALNIIEKYLINRKDPLFIMFDDWGCHADEVPDAFYEWKNHAEKVYNFKVEKFSSTNLTRYIKLSFE
jgi:hypothetical protein